MKKLLASTTFVLCVLLTQVWAETTECTNITAVPITITVQGVYCFKQNVTTNITSGIAITINANNVTIDMNGFKLGGAAAGPATNATGIYAHERKNIIIRNGSIRGFRYGIHLTRSSGVSSGHLVEDVILDGNTQYGTLIRGTGVAFRNNRIVNMSSSEEDTIYGLFLIGEDTVITDNLIANFAETTFRQLLGIYLTSSENITVRDNVISGLEDTGTGGSYGIYTSNADTVSISNNTILDITASASGYGIYLNDSNGVTVFGNQILNSVAGGTTGVSTAGTSTGINCIDNVVAGYTTSLSGCNFSVGNHKP